MPRRGRFAKPRVGLVQDRSGPLARVCRTKMTKVETGKARTGTATVPIGESTPASRRPA